jgi:hypothetical protein
VISGFHFGVAENCTLLGCYTARSDDFSMFGFCRKKNFLTHPELFIPYMNWKCEVKELLFVPPKIKFRSLDSPYLIGAGVV